MRHEIAKKRAEAKCIFEDRIYHLSSKKINQLIPVKKKRRETLSI